MPYSPLILGSFPKEAYLESVVLQILRENFAPAVLATALAVTPICAQADEHCEPLIEINGRTLSAGASAYTTSLIPPLPVSVVATPGRDEGVGNVPQTLVEVFGIHQVMAKCFIDQYVSKSGEPEYQFYLAGILLEYKGKNFFTLDDFRTDKTIIASFARRARIRQTIASVEKADVDPSLD